MATDTSFGKVREFYDFNEGIIDVTVMGWSIDSDAGGTCFAIKEEENGVITGYNDGTDGDLTNLFSHQIWEANDGGPLVLEVRAKTITSVADGETFIGWTDQDDADENPLLVSTADALTSAATDAVGFMYTGAGTASWKFAGSKNGSDTAVSTASTGGATTPVVGTYQTFRIVLDILGNADFFINGIFQGHIDSCVTAGTQLGFGCCIQGGGTARSLDIDYIYMEKGRA